MSQSWPLDLRTAKATKLSLILVTAVALGAAPAARAGAQETGRHTAGTTVSGIVYDSLSGKPLAGALVQIARKRNDSPALSAQSGADGAYAIADVPPGSYIIGFFHPALDLLGLGVTPRTVEIAGDAPTHVARKSRSGTPSSSRISSG